MKHRSRTYFERIRKSRFEKSNRRNKRKKSKKRGFYKYYLDILETADKKGFKPEYLPKYHVFSKNYKYQNNKRPSLSDNIRYLESVISFFDKTVISLPADGRFMVPHPFSLTTNFNQSFLFLKRLFYAFHEDAFEIIILDY